MKNVALIILFFSSLSVLGQGSADYGSGMKINLSPDGNKFIRLISWNQIWVRATQMNPGSEVNGEYLRTNYDVAARRVRMLAYAQINERYIILMHFGINNQTFASGGGSGSSGTGGYGVGKKPQIFFHDFWNEYALILPSGKNRRTSLSVGAGMHYFMGISRITQGSTLNFLMVDSPIFSWPTIENSDQFARQLGVFAKGKINKIEYRFAINKPFVTSLSPSEITGAATDHNGKSAFAKAGYVEYQFLETESNVLPYKVGSYLGTRRVFNLGAGFYSQPAGTKSIQGNETKSHTINLMAVDAFADLPFGEKSKNMAVTFYSGFFSYDFGPDYLRNTGIMNPAVPSDNYSGSDRLMAGAGNAQPMIGTGNIFHAQVGILLPKTAEKPKLRVQPFAGFTHKDFDALPVGVNNYDGGVNWLIDGHHAKITTQYSLRPGVEAVTGKKRSMGEFIAQLQIYL